MSPIFLMSFPFLLFPFLLFPFLLFSFLLFSFLLFSPRRFYMFGFKFKVYFFFLRSFSNMSSKYRCIANTINSGVI